MLQKLGASMRIRQRLLDSGESFLANDNIARHIEAGELDELEAEVAAQVRQLLETLVIDVENDHNTKDTARRMAKLYVREVFAGRYQAAPPVTDFPNAKQLDEIYTVGPITVRSACSHHMCPIQGQAWCAVIPGSRVIGLSKFTRLVNWVMARPQIQEEAVVQIADTLEGLIEPRALAVIIRAEHSCMSWRGVRDNGTVMVTSVMRGLFRESGASRSELMALLKGQGF